MDGWGVFTVTPLFICACSSAGRAIDFLDSSTIMIARLFEMEVCL